MNLWKKAKVVKSLIAKKDGFINQIKTKELGYIVRDMSKKKVNKIDNAAGIKLFVKSNSKVLAGDKLAEVYANSEVDALDAISRLEGTLIIKNIKKSKGKLIQAIIR